MTAIGLYCKKDDEHSQNCLSLFKSLLAKKSIDFCDLSKGFSNDLLKDIKLLVVFGGDGSVLSATKIAEDLIPIVGVNTGNLGFLTSYEATTLDKLVEDIMSNNLTFSKRRFMTIKYGDKEFRALNDAVVEKDHVIDRDSGCVRLKLTIDGQFVDNYVGDGLIVSTPTGSTAYAISAGGPIMVPNVDAYVAAPICAHSLHSRPIVYSCDSVAKVTVHKSSKDCVLYVDGFNVATVAPDSSITIEASDKFAEICDNTGKFFSRLSDKLNKWSNNDLLEVDHG